METTSIFKTYEADAMTEWLDEDLHAWDIVEEAARLASIAKECPNDLHLAGRIYGMAEALAIMSRDHDKGAWHEYIEAFAEDNYESGRRVE